MIERGKSYYYLRRPHFMGLIQLASWLGSQHKFATFDTSPVIVLK
jgi:hypothetical protein